MRKMQNVAVVVCFLMVLAVIFMMQSRDPVPDGDVPSVRIAVLYSDAAFGQTETGREVAAELFDNFDQGLLLNAQVEKVNVVGGMFSLSGFDLVYPDESLIDADKSMMPALEAYVKAGGMLVIEPRTRDLVSKEMLGVDGFEAITPPESLEFPETTLDFSGIQEVVGDYFDAMLKFVSYPELRSRTCGFAVTPRNAQPLVKTGDGKTIFSVNKAGKGRVLYFGALLPSEDYITAFDFEKTGGNQLFFNNTASTALRMLRNEAAVSASKLRLGFAVKKVFGPYGRPAIAWQQHFEVLSAIKDGSMQKMTDLCESLGQVASMSLVYAPYEWFKRYESIGVHYGRGPMDFSGSPLDDSYAPGRHAVVDGKWLNLVHDPENFSYFKDTELPYRAYPYVYDYNNDGVPDLLCGSSDGYFYAYRGISTGEDWMLDKPEKLKGADGNPLAVSGYSAPVLADVNGDAVPDLISGCEDGNVYVFEADSGGAFLPARLLQSSPKPGLKLSAPDFDARLLCGYDSGEIYEFPEVRIGAQNLPADGASGAVLVGDVGEFAAPRYYDCNGDGQPDIVSGSRLGYLSIFERKSDGGYAAGGYISGGATNYKGNDYLKSGSNSVPFFADVNNDGVSDLICGRLEYGEFTVRLDSPYFPYADELKQAVDYAREHYVEILPHDHSHEYKSAQDELVCLTALKDALAKYGIQWENRGINQHTWYTSGVEEPVQTLRVQYGTGLAWNFGFKPPVSDATPGSGSEYRMVLPFYMKNQGEKTMLLFNPAQNEAEDTFKTTVKYDMPISIYNHSEYKVLSEHKTVEQEYAKMGTIARDNLYCFVTEPQMAKLFDAVLRQSVSISKKEKRYNLSALALDYPTRLRDESYDSALGAKIEVGQRYKSRPPKTDADVWARRGDALYVGLNRPVSIWFDSSGRDTDHVASVNAPAKITRDGKSVTVSFEQDGLQTVSVRCKKPDYSGDGFKTVQVGDYWHFFKTGPKSTLVINNLPVPPAE